MLAFEQRNVAKISAAYHPKVTEQEANYLATRMIAEAQRLRLPQNRNALFVQEDDRSELSANFRTLLVLMIDILENSSAVQPELILKLHSSLFSFLPEIRMLFKTTDDHTKRLGLDCLFVLGGLFQFKKAECKQALEIIGKNDEQSMHLLYQPQTVAKMLTLLLYMYAAAPEVWQGSKKLREVLYEFLMKANFELLTQALNPVRVFQWGIYDRTMVCLLPHLGFSAAETEHIGEVWDAAVLGSELVKTAETVRPNIEIMLLMERRVQGILTALHRMFGITDFTRFPLEVYVSQLLLLTAPQSERPTMMWDISMQQDYGNTIRTSKQHVFTAQKIMELAEQGLQVVSVELGGSGEQMAVQLDSLSKIIGKPQHILFSAHTNTKGIMQKTIQAGPYMSDAQGNWTNAEDYWEVVPIADVQKHLVPAVERLRTPGGTLVLDVCRTDQYAPLFQGNVLHSGAERSVMSALRFDRSCGLQPSFSVLERDIALDA